MSPNELTSILSANIKKFRKKRGLSQFALAEDADVSEGTVKSVELMRQWPSEKTLARLADALGVEVFELFLPDTGRLGCETKKTDGLKNLIAQNIREYVDNVLENI